MIKILDQDFHDVYDFVTICVESASSLLPLLSGENDCFAPSFAGLSYIAA